MKKRRHLLLMSFCAFVLSTANAMAQSRKPLPKPVATAPAASIDNSQALYLARTTLMTLHDANSSGNYTVLRDLGSPSFQTRSAAELAKMFAPLRERNLDLFTAASTTPSLSGPSAIGPDQRLHIRGRFLTRPDEIVFDFAFEPVSGAWKYSGLALALEKPAGS
jgi:hypothetical protein